MSTAGELLERYALEAEPTCLSADQGRLYVGFADHVEVIDTGDGSRRLWPDLGAQAVVTSIAASRDGIYVADAGNRMVLRFDRGGSLKGSITGDFLIPSPYFDLAPAPDGSLWVVNPGRHRLQHYDPAGSLLGSWGRGSMDIDGFGGCCNPTHIALLPNGSFVTSEKGIPRVKVYDPDGGLAALVAVPKDFSEYEAGLDLAVTPDGTIALLVPRERALRLYRPAPAAVDGS
jgi:sugar lactone lactonase YvrE